jgi:hypothetical protein
MPREIVEKKLVLMEESLQVLGEQKLLRLRDIPNDVMNH